MSSLLPLQLYHRTISAAICKLPQHVTRQQCYIGLSNPRPTLGDARADAIAPLKPRIPTRVQDVDLHLAFG